MKAMIFKEEIPALPNNLFQNHYVLVFDLTSLQDAGENIHYPELSLESILLEMFFDHPLRSVTELVVLGERMTTVKIDHFGTAAKNFSDFCVNENFFNIFFNFLWVLQYCFLHWNICGLNIIVTQLPFCSPMNLIK